MRRSLHPRIAARLGAVALALGFAAGCGDLFLQPDRVERLTPDQIGLVYEDVWVDVPGRDRVHGWRLVARPTDAAPVGTLVFFHGNAQNVSAHIASVHWLPARGYEVYLFDYAGFGRSPGEPTLDGAHADAEAALRWVAARPDVDPERLVLLGQSLGGSIGLEVARRVRDEIPLAAVVADSAFSSYRGIAREKLASHWLTWTFQWPLSLLVPGEPEPLEAIAELDGDRVLLIAGSDDVIVPPHHSEALAAAAPPGTELWLLPGAVHIESLTLPDVRRRFVAYLHERVAPPGPTTARAPLAHRERPSHL